MADVHNQQRSVSGRKWVSVDALPWLAALILASVFVARDPARLSAPFGPSHDGFNAALYLTGGRAIVEEGPVASRFGASSSTLSGDRVVYAHHPPFVYLADAAALSIAPSVELAARLPAVMSSLGGLVLLALLLSACEVSPAAAGFGILFACATPMFMLFGGTTEPHALGLAPMTALALLWQRARHEPLRSLWPIGLIAALATFTSWQAGLFAACVAVALLTYDRHRRAAFAVAGGVALAALVIGLWILWAYDGDPREFVERAIHRTGTAGRGRVSVGQMAWQQSGYLGDLFPFGGVLVIGVATLGLLDGRTRPIVAASLGTVLGYALLFRNGAYDHNYWLYCILLPLGVSAAAAADAASRWLSRRQSLRIAPRILGAGCLAVLTITLLEPSQEERLRKYAAVMGAQARALPWPAAQRYAYHAFGGRGYTDLLPWLRFYARREPFGVDGPQSVPQGDIMLRLANGRLTHVAGEQEVKP